MPAHKLKTKKLDMIAANDISASDAGFGVDTNRITLLFPDGSQEALPLMGKDEAAEILIDRLAAPAGAAMTRILVISDIHGNLEALEAVLDDAGTVDQTWCLGDIAGYGPQPNECIAADDRTARIDLHDG